MRQITINKNVLLFLAIIFSNFLSFTGGISNYTKPIQTLALACLFIYCFVSKSPFKKNGLYVKKYVLLFLILPWFSIFSAYLSHEQSIIQTIQVTLIPVGSLILYFVLIKFQISEENTIKMLYIFAFMYTFLELFQQFTYPIYWFSGRSVLDSTGALEVRLGMYKFYISGIHLLFIPLFHSWEQLLNKLNRKHIVYFLILVLGLYVFLARKFVFSFLITVGISFFLGKRIKWYYWFIIIISFIAVYVFSDQVFGNYIEKTRSELSDDDFVRFQSSIFYSHYFKDPLCYIFGNGIDYPLSSYGKEIQYYQDYYGFYRADIGILAYFSFYGIVGLVSVILFIFFIIKRWRTIPFYLKLYLIFNLLQTSIAFPLNSIIGTFSFAIFLYLLEFKFQERDFINYHSHITANANNRIKLLKNLYQR